MTDCVIRGDLANVRIGRHCIISKRAVIRPPFKKFSKGYGDFLELLDSVNAHEFFHQYQLDESTFIFRGVRSDF